MDLNECEAWEKIFVECEKYMVLTIYVVIGITLWFWFGVERGRNIWLMSKVCVCAIKTSNL